MAYRFMLDVPEAAHDDAKTAIESVRNAQILIDRHPRPHTPDPVVTEADVFDSRAELTVVAHTLDVIDALYHWMGEREINTDVYVDAHKGGKLHLPDYTAPELRAIIQGDQYWFANTMPKIHYPPDVLMEGGALVSEVPYGGRAASSAIVPAETQVALGGIDHVAVRVRDMAKAEAWYRDFFGMDIIYRARRAHDRWQHLPADFSWDAGVHSGIEPEIVRLENGPIAIVLINAGMGAVMHENRVAHLSLNAPIETVNAVRGRALFASFTIIEDTARSFGFVDPFGITWQLIASSS
ncbi:MAG TPA: VOC family protein [Thermomicrobiales bacterium]|nr:VOC family protein [Thermomicrobiales bacterium]